MGDVYFKQDNYHKATECYDKAISFGRELGLKKFSYAVIYLAKQISYTLPKYLQKLLN